ncbi:hypothetical protein H2200_006582 [Cladophialophora chaetospira]|uniref:Uncharacterized protein n=1 Tax=Cladophialophora chaetospira TaxID=386627 RepID=A0AA38X8G6_9EURO|nr:hypothetical protein H2200_006582 [Cladophialophora chaetospira]
MPKLYWHLYATMVYWASTKVDHSPGEKRQQFSKNVHTKRVEMRLLVLGTGLPATLNTSQATISNDEATRVGDPTCISEIICGDATFNQAHVLPLEDDPSLPGATRIKIIQVGALPRCTNDVALINKRKSGE